MNKKLFWFARLMVLLVFIWNVQSAIVFLIRPELYMGAYELSGEVGRATIRGIAVLFLMWNCTYPLVIFNPDRYRTLYAIVLMQQFVGLIGESFIYLTIREYAPLLASSIIRFVLFDGIGLVMMGVPFLFITRKRCASPLSKSVDGG